MSGVGWVRGTDEWPQTGECVSVGREQLLLASASSYPVELQALTCHTFSDFFFFFQEKEEVRVFNGEFPHF